MYSPRSLDTVVEATPVPSWVATTVTPGRTAPLSSVTRPTITPVSICANAEVAKRGGKEKTSRQTRARHRNMGGSRERVVFVPKVYARYFRMESMLSFPDPTAAKYRKMKQ